MAPVRHLFGRVARPPARPETPGAFYHRLRRMGIDGTVPDVPDSAADATAFGRPSAGPRGGAFPRVKKLSLVEPGTRAEVAFVGRPGGRDERAMVAGLPGHLTPGMLLLLGRAFFGDERWRHPEATGGRLLVRAVKSMTLRPIRPPADGSYPAKVYRNDSHRRKDRDGVVVRVIRYTLDDPPRVGHGVGHVRITDRPDEAAHPADEWILLGHERWEEELTFDEQKARQDPRRATKPAQLRSGTPAGVLRELYALSRGHFVIRSLMFEAAGTAGLDPDALSFTRCFQILTVPAAGVREHDSREVRGVVPGGAVGDAGGADRPAAQPDQPPGGQAEGVEMGEETTRASAPPALEENLSRGSGYAPRTYAVMKGRTAVERCTPGRLRG